MHCLIQKYWDGGITDNCPILSEDTVTVCPFSGEFDICPTSQEFGDYLRFTSANVNVHVTSTNFWRLSRALYPPEPEKLRKLCQQGYDDTLRYLQSHSKLGITFILISLGSSKTLDTIGLSKTSLLTNIRTCASFSSIGRRSCEII